MLLLSTLDDIAWLLNLRGNDIQFNPVFFSYLIYHISNDELDNSIDLFIDESKVDDPVLKLRIFHSFFSDFRDFQK